MMMKTAQLLLFLSALLLFFSLKTALAADEQLRGSASRNLQFQPFDPTKVKVLIQYKTEQGKEDAKSKASTVGYESERFQIVAMEVDSKEILALENDPNIASVSLNQEKHVIRPIEVRNGSGISAQSTTPLLTKPGKSRPAKTINTKKRRRRRLNEEVPWGIEAVQALGVAQGPDAQYIKVCVVDTGFSVTHPDLPGRDTVNGTDNELYKDSDEFEGHEWDVDEDGHGTHVA